jgi:sigma-B regulation protein RsbU (phosphoserine phosphatase)
MPNAEDQGFRYNRVMSIPGPADLADAQAEIERLRTLIEASKLINSSIDDEDLFESILMVAKNELDVERGTLYFMDHERQEIWSKIASGLDAAEIRLPVGKGLAGSVAATGEPIVIHDAYSDPRFDRSSDEKSGFVTRSMLCVPIRNRELRIVGVLQLLNKRSGEFGTEDLDFLASLSENMAIAMENAMLHKSAIEKNRMERELQLGREIQSRLFPSPPDDVPSTTIAATSHACYEVGGDYYDFMTTEKGSLGVVIADVSGKGVAAALIMSSVQAALRIAAPSAESLAGLAQRLNETLYRTAGGKKYVTMFFGVYEPDSGRLRYVNAGHNPPIICRDGDVSMLDSTGTPVGLFPSRTYEEDEVVLPPGSTLCLYTDGFVEAENPEGEEVGMDYWVEMVRDACEGAVDAMPDALLARVHEFESGAMPTDDKTIVILRRQS